MGRFIAAAVVMVFLGSPDAKGEWMNPSGLNPGDTYHVAFVTQGIHDALSTDIAVYNDFVNTQAHLVGAVTESVNVSWFAIASTPSVDARDNAIVSAPVFLLDGTRVADGYSDMWDATAGMENGVYTFHNGLHSPISIDQFGLPRSLNLDEWSTGVWTGSSGNGTAFPDDGLRIGEVYPVLGRFTENNLNWIEGFANPSASKSYPLYALSGLLTVPSNNAVPAPSSLACLVGVGVTVFGMEWWKKRRRNAVAKTR